MARPARQRPGPWIIEISSDDDSDDDVVLLSPPPRGRTRAPPQTQHEKATIENPPPPPPPLPQLHQRPTMPIPIAGYEGAAPQLRRYEDGVNGNLADDHTDDHTDNAWTGPLSAIDLTGSFASDPSNPSEATAADPATNETLTDDIFAARILDIFPDIAHDHIRQLFDDGAEGGTCSGAWCSSIIHRLLDDGNYPKERERRQELKRKRAVDSAEAEFERYEAANRTWPDTMYAIQARRILSEEFPEIPVNYINNTLKARRYLFPTFLQLFDEFEGLQSNPNPPFRKVRSRTRKNHAPNETSGPNELSKELNSAKAKVHRKEAQRREEVEHAQQEEQNERDSRARNAMADCGCCFTETPTNRMTFCSGDEPHQFCYDCARQYIKTLIGDSKCSPTCIDTSGCTAPFARAQLRSFLDAKSWDKLERMQQQEDIRLAQLDDLVECPFCDFKAVCPPVEVDREFRCQNPDCEKVSCRLCSRATHVPLSCKEAEQESKANVRHAVEEAMTEALVRSCNKCNNKFIKEIGCNKMTCPRCGNKQCYVCSKNIRDYSHFDRGGCQMADDTNTRHRNEVSKAEREVRAKLLAENPDLTAKDLDIATSEAVKHDESQRGREEVLAPVMPQPGPPPPGLPFFPLGYAQPMQLARMPAWEAPLPPLPPHLMDGFVPAVPAMDAPIFHQNHFGLLGPQEQQIRNPWPPQARGPAGLARFQMNPPYDQDNMFNPW